MRPAAERRTGTGLRVGLRVAVASAIVSVAGVVGLVLPACTDDPGATKVSVSEKRVSAVVTIAPLAGIVRALLPEGSEVTILMPPGRSEHGYEFTPKDLATIGKADLVVQVGLGLEPKVEQFLREHPSEGRAEVVLGKVLGISEGEESHEHHAHDEHGNCLHDHGVDPHVWLDPVLVAEAVPALAEAVIKAGARTKEDLTGATRAAQERLIKRLRELDAEYAEALKPFQGRAIVTHHAAWGRLASRYGLRIADVLRPAESSEPTPEQMASVVEALKRENVPAVFIEPQYDAKSARRIADQAGLPVKTLDPLGEGDYFAMMRSNLGVLVSALNRK